MAIDSHTTSSGHSPNAPVIVQAEHADNGVVITFQDGPSCFYSAKLLASIQEQASELSASPSDSAAVDLPDSYRE